MSQVSRRSFMKLGIIGGGVVVAGGVSAVAYMLAGNKRGRVKAEMTIPPEEVPGEGEAPYRNSDGQFFLIRNADGALALSWVCTHQGCRVRWNDGRDQFECPCHSSFFDRHGVVTAGPAPRPLELMPVRVTASGDVIVDTRETISRQEYDPSQAVPLGRREWRNA